jgi:Carboxypeptidase regulatory-like domain
MSIAALLVCLMVQSPSTPAHDPARRAASDDGKCVLKGRVLDSSSGRPIKGAMVTAFLDDRSGQRPSTTTDVDGRWELRGLRPGEYQVGTEKAGYVGGDGIGRNIGLTELRPERSIDLTLTRGAVLSGRIVDDAGEPVAGLEVMALYRDSNNHSSPQWVSIGSGVSTDDRGDFRIYGLPAGDYIVAAKPQSRLQQTDDRGPRVTTVVTYYPGTANIDEAQRFSLEPAVEHSDLVFSLQEVRAISIRGRVLLPAGQVAESFAALFPVNADGDAEMGNDRLTATSPDGTFTFSGVPAGNYRLGVRLLAAPGEERIGELDVAAGQEDITDLVVPTVGPTVIRGRVIAPTSATLPAVVGVNATPLRSGMHMASNEGAIVSAHDATFELKAYSSPVLFRASVRSEEWAQSAVTWKGRDVSRGLSFESGQVIEGVEITLRRTTSRVTGTVSGVSRGADDHEGTVVLFRRDDGDGSPGNDIAGTAPIRDGRFTTKGLAAGEYQVIAVRTFDRTVYTRREIVEMLRSRATEVSLRDGETRAVALTLITEY